MSKLKEAREVVDTLKKKAADQSLILAEKQKEADESMTEISNTIQVALDEIIIFILEEMEWSLLQIHLKATIEGFCKMCI